MTVAEAIAKATKRLNAAGVPGAARDARILLSIALGIDRTSLIKYNENELDADTQARFFALVAGREERRPVSHLTGKREFYGRDFNVTSSVLDPRPDTETLVSVALEKPFSNVLDMGTGSGCILLTLLAEMPLANGVGTDVSSDALAIACANADKIGVAERCKFKISDWFENVDGKFDLIVSNPPYIAADEMDDLEPEVRKWEPKVALTPGGDGLDAYRRISEKAYEYLTDSGRLLFEIGPTQADSVLQMLDCAGFVGLRVVQDLDGRDRVVVGERVAG